MRGTRRPRLSPTAGENPLPLEECGEGIPRRRRVSHAKSADGLIVGLESSAREFVMGGRAQRVLTQLLLVPRGADLEHFVERLALSPVALLVASIDSRILFNRNPRALGQGLDRLDERVPLGALEKPKDVPAPLHPKQ